ncbi:hypothetical protein KKG56_03455, partial [bacterium]|nr:hypothetical protein [bacterium]
HIFLITISPYLLHNPPHLLFLHYLNGYKLFIGLHIMAVLAVGYPVNKRRIFMRKGIEELVICWK